MIYLYITYDYIYVHILSVHKIVLSSHHHLGGQTDGHGGSINSTCDPGIPDQGPYPNIPAQPDPLPAVGSPGESDKAPCACGE